MPWGRVDDTYYDHPKLDELDDVHEWPDRLAGAGLNSLAWSWCNRFLTDGKVPRSTVTKLGGTIELADMLVRTGLWETASGGYQIHDFLVYNDSAAQVRERREGEARRKAEYRAKRRPGGTTTGTEAAAEHDVPPSVPAGQAVPVGVPAGHDATDVPLVVPRDSRAHARGRTPDPTRPDPTRPTDSPQTPASGGHGGRRANGTNPRAVAKAASDQVHDEAKGRRYRAQQRQLAVYRGDLTDAERVAMNERDAPLEEIPGWTEHQAELAAEALL